MKKGVITVLLSVLLSGLTAFAIVKNADDSTMAGIASMGESAPGSAYRTVNLSQTDYPDFSYAAETAVDAVVYIEVTATMRQQQTIDPFSFFFGWEQPRSREQQVKGSGSGVIIRQDGYIVTNNHVIANASDIQVTLNNNKTFGAKIIGTDPATDVALIKIDAEGLPTIEFTDSDKVRLGEWVLAIGSPLGRELQSTITAGIVSAKGRQMRGDRKEGELKIESFIQTDAAVNPGNSGGALVNKEGKLVGINTAIVSTTNAYSGYSFAIPSNIVSKIVGDLIDFGSVKRVMLGIAGGNVNDEIAKEMKLSSLAGVYISEVSKGGAADKAGLKPKDVIIALGTSKISTMSELQEKVNMFHPGDEVDVTVIRNGNEKTFTVVFENMPEQSAASFYGAELREVEGGVEIVSAGNGKLAQAGATDGFIIKYVNDEKVSKPQDVIDIAKKSRRAIFIEGVTASGRPGYFGFGKDE